jgi:hypothetical protein
MSDKSNGILSCYRMIPLQNLAGGTKHQFLPKEFGENKFISSKPGVIITSSSF